MVTCITGRLKAIPVWDYFECNQEGNSSKCKIKIVKSYEEKECDRIIRGKNPTNLKQHMSKIHPDQYALLFETNSANKPPFKQFRLLSQLVTERQLEKIVNWMI